MRIKRSPHAHMHANARMHVSTLSPHALSTKPHPRATPPHLQVYELSGPELKLSTELEKSEGFKCASLGAAAASSQQLATGGFDGKLQIWDLDNAGRPVFQAQAHASIVNAVDGFGGRVRGYGPPEIATGGRDGCVRVWDVRQADAPVAAFEPGDPNNVRWVCAPGGRRPIGLCMRRCGDVCGVRG